MTLTKAQITKLFELLEAASARLTGTSITNSTINGPTIPPPNEFTRDAIVALASAASQNAITISNIADKLQTSAPTNSYGVYVSTPGQDYC